jgi:magnesium chelatase family protein
MWGMQIYAPLTSEHEPRLQQIEIASSFQLPGFYIVGLPSPEVAEARERIRAALESSGFSLPKRRIVVNLSPASIKKRGTGLDLAMALAVLSLGESKTHPSPLTVAAWGELGLDGQVRSAGQPTRALFAAWEAQIPFLFIAEDELHKMKTIRGWIQTARYFNHRAPVLIPVSSLAKAWAALQNLDDHPELSQIPLDLKPSLPKRVIELSKRPVSPPFEQLLPLPSSLERFIGIAAAGNHHLILLGAKGVGKSHAMEWLIQLQPESSDKMKVHRALLAELNQPFGELESNLACVRRISPAVKPSALLGSANAHWIRPGEFSLAHGGLLVADEFPEWARDSREALREPLETGKVRITRSKLSIELPARFSLAANGNLCFCGGWPPEQPIPLEIQTSGRRIPRCRCTARVRREYKARLSGPILDRMDMVLFVGQSTSKRGKKSTSENLFYNLKSKVDRCRLQLVEKWGEIPGLLSGAQTEKLLETHPHWDELIERMQFSGDGNTSLRARHKIVRVALSLSAWDGLDEPVAGHFMEAASYRPERFGLCD